MDRDRIRGLWAALLVVVLSATFGFAGAHDHEGESAQGSICPACSLTLCVGAVAGGQVETVERPASAGWIEADPFAIPDHVLASSAGSRAPPAWS